MFATYIVMDLMSWKYLSVLIVLEKLHKLYGAFYFFIDLL